MCTTEIKPKCWVWNTSTTEAVRTHNHLYSIDTNMWPGLTKRDIYVYSLSNILNLRALNFLSRWSIPVCFAHQRSATKKSSLWKDQGNIFQPLEAMGPQSYGIEKVIRKSLLSDQVTYIITYMYIRTWAMCVQWPDVASCSTFSSGSTQVCEVGNSHLKQVCWSHHSFNHLSVSTSWWCLTASFDQKCPAYMRIKKREFCTTQMNTYSSFGT